MDQVIFQVGFLQITTFHTIAFVIWAVTAAIILAKAGKVASAFIGTPVVLALILLTSYVVVILSSYEYQAIMRPEAEEKIKVYGNIIVLWLSALCLAVSVAAILYYVRHLLRRICHKKQDVVSRL
ncbi:hypothetical protein KJ866_01100 [Patescibacteria group bacterium]|nr:hypothetical protein [Patescibacteria group bacterium]MBU2264746.1 hypothetical protein [Patescibacteria group bacterium]